MFKFIFRNFFLEPLACILLVSCLTEYFLHEVNHNLGLDHSSQRDSFMIPSYTELINNLSNNDIWTIRSLYGFKTSSTGQIIKYNYNN